MFEVQSVWCPNLKNIDLYGLEYTVPKSMKWAAVDKDGSLYCFKNKPRQSVNDKQWVGGGTRYYIGIACYTGEWTESIIKLEE